MGLAGRARISRGRTGLFPGVRGRRVFPGQRLLHRGLRRCRALASPDVHPNEEGLGEVIESTVEESTRGDLYKVLGQLEEYHPDEPHWFLPLIGVDPICQGRGHGSALMQHALKQCDLDPRSAYLDSEAPSCMSVTVSSGVGKSRLGPRHRSYRWCGLRGRTWLPYHIVYPPSTTKSWPVTYADAADARYTTAPCRSSG